MTDAVTRVPLSASAEWQDKRVTTDPPRYIPHLEWMLLVRLAAPMPLRVVVLLNCSNETQWGLLDAEPSRDIAFTTKFFPDDWTASDDVQVNVGGPRLNVTDARLKADPRQAVNITLPSAPVTGDEFSVAELPDHGIEVRAVSFAAQDTEHRRLHRWRVKPTLASVLPPRLAQLTSGRQSGVFGPNELSSSP